MKTHCKLLSIALTAICSLLLVPPGVTYGQQAEDLKQLKGTVNQMQETIKQLNNKILELERASTNQNPVAPAAPKPAPEATTEPPSSHVIEAVASGGTIGKASPVEYRHSLIDRQLPATRPEGFTLEPKYQGFIPIPNTPGLIKFNAKPYLALVVDNRNAGSDQRFVPALFPLRGSPEYGGRGHASVTANGSQLRVDVRAPEIPGNFRFYYQNDFFGDDQKNMRYRLQHLFGTYYGFKAGFTYGVWEDPDVWPDWVDYEGPNSVIFARRPVAHYTYAWTDNWNTTFAVEDPDIYFDTDSFNANSQVNRLPDFGLNTRYEKEGLGHLQASAIFRDIGASDIYGSVQHALGWGVNLGVGLDVGKRDTLQLLGVYGEGVGGMGNDTSFLNSDGAFDLDGDLVALPYWSAMIGFTHHWSDSFRSTVTYGYAHLDPTDGQAATFYEFSHVASANLVWQLRKRLSIGLEGLYGFKEAQNGEDSGNHWRVEVGMVYSLFD